LDVTPENGAVWIGANFWSRVGGPRMWSRYNAAVVREELAVLARHGCNVTRSFCFWPDFVPEVERLDEDVLARFTDFLDAHVEAGLGTIPTIVVGHMSGENWDPAWRQGRDLYRDAWLVSQQAWLAHELARRFGGHEAVVGWLLSNEMPLYGGPAASEDVVAWARALVEAIRSAGATQPISVGDGAWGVEVTGRDNGYSLRALSPLVDFLGPHSYPMLDDPVRQSLAAAFACELAGGFGTPVVLEEFGVSSDFAADDHAADYYRQVLHTSLLAGARGWLAWNNCDYDDLWEEDPYRHHVFELHFGLTDRAGRPKPQLEELSAFASLVRELSRSGWERMAGDAALVVPEHFERVLPFTDDAFRSDLGADLLQGYVAAREADLPIGLLRERDGLPDTARLYLVPSAKLLTGPGLRRLQALATGGATVYASYFAGSTPYQRGPWLTWLDEIFGIRHRLRYGLVDPIEDEEVVLELVEELGDLGVGTLLRFHVAGTPSARSYLPVEPAGARVVAVDGHGRPALLRHELGSGTTFFCTYPLEHMAARTPSVNPEDTWRLYDALATLAGVSRPVRVDDPRVFVGRVRGGARETVLFVNSSSDTVQAEPVVAGGEALVPSGTLTIGPYGVAVTRRSINPTIRSAPAGVAALAAGERRDAQL
jgi:endo-1,4-beta-mannosidase